jgi:tRNA pseudouridine55 synthase
VSRVSGIAALAKPAGVTSFAALHPLKRSLDSGKIGHAGTLDRFATGLLIALVGSYSRLNPFFSSLDKTYRATVIFGRETDTLDPEGGIVAEAPPPGREAVEAVLASFRGAILQRPPVYSALHIDGKRAYERALKGEEVEMKPRPVTIHSLELLEWRGPEADFLVNCSSGTYIRSLARDIGLAAGSRASLLALSRESIGPIRLDQAVEPGLFDPANDLILLDPSLAHALGLRPRILSASALPRFSQGGRVGLEELAGVDGLDGEGLGPSAVFSPEGLFLGLVDEVGPGVAYRFVCGGGA